jgi:hypothetical protein
VSLTGRTVLRRAAALVSAVAILTGAFVAGRASVGSVGNATAELPGSAGEQTIWTVREETVGQSLTFTGQLTVSSRAGPVARSEGVVTAVHIDAPRQVEAGTTLYSVDLRPMVAAEGPLPAFRPLAQGDRGEDVSQLRGFLCAQGWEAACGDSTLFDQPLADAVRAWQQGLGVDADAVVRVGDILWFASLPARVRPTEALAVGELAPNNVRPFTVDAAVPTLRVAVSREQAALVPAGAPVVVAGDHEAVVEQVLPAADPDAGAEFLVTMSAADEREPFCVVNELCAQLLGDHESATVEVTIHTVPERSGPVVPVAAIETDPAGRTRVRLADGTRREVTVLAVAGGVVVVDGLRPGEEIVIP